MHREMGQPFLVETLLPEKPGLTTERLERVRQAVDCGSGSPSAASLPPLSGAGPAGGCPGPLDRQPVRRGVGKASRSPEPTVLPMIGWGEFGGLAYAWSNSDPTIARSLLIWWIVPVARSRLPCLGMIARRPLAAFTYISWDPLAWRRNLQPRLSTQAFRLCAQVPAGHAVTVKAPSERCKGVRSCPSSLQTWMMVCATAKRLLRVANSCRVGSY